ncbi:hypothetical protein CAMRE0001_2010 [Campylobacter rectus RM3267]|uniref:Uncharacterized protein n=1 Tax=Campylobacter rectus RM3267 TaxID=553218 RepID=B9D3D1_CAMRE|nr:hypothetical protein CAMRE0001_2010 [Campylobacter rectus RM3267]
MRMTLNFKMLKFKSNLQNLNPNTEHKSSVWPLAAIFKF